VTDIARELVTSESPTMGRAPAGGRPCQGVWHRPVSTRPTIALIATHYDVDFSEHYLADLMAQRGYGFLGWNTRYRGLGTYFTLDSALVDISVGVRWLRDIAGVRTVVLLGNSGGASLMAAYQARAMEPSGASSVAAGDLFISLNAHPGRPDVLTSWLDPSVVDECDPLSVDASIDMFEPSNGPPYPPEFVTRYRAAQVARNERITAWALEERQRLRAKGASDRVFTVHRAWADLRFLDLSLDPSERNTGCYFGDPRSANYGSFGLACTSTLRSWLSMWSLSESRCRAGPHLARISEPSLVVQSTADQGCYPSDAHAIFDSLGGEDKRLQMVAGDHYLVHPQTARDAVADLISEWLARWR
jgi:pimeloyl-ACP methyl ester carboxylesterase